MKLKIGIVSSSGGHLLNIQLLNKWWSDYDHFFVTRNDKMARTLLRGEKVYFGHFPENRNLINLVRNLFQAIYILNKERPHVVFSTGAGIAPPYLLIARLMGIKTVFMETFVSINKPTLSGRICYFFSTLFVVQNRELLGVYPKAKYWGSLL